MDTTKAQEFADALTDLCVKHGMMIWTVVPVDPILATAVTADVEFHYVAQVPVVGNSIVIRRVLEKRP